MFLKISNDILNAETSESGYYDTIVPMLLYKGLEIGKIKGGDETDRTTFYTLKKDNEEFKFAVRSYYIPPGIL